MSVTFTHAEPTADRSALRRAIRRHRSARAIASSWRAMVGSMSPRHAPIIVGCSGGADSVALAASLWAFGAHALLAHVRHDMRTPEEVDADERLVAHLAERLGMPHESVSITRERGNVEHVSRRRRYDALARIAETHGSRFVATAHHADDQLETLLLALMRGAGTAGLAGVRHRRSLSPSAGVELIRPALGVRAAQLEALCADCGLAWSEDASNRDLTRRRAAIRARIAPEIEGLAPAAARRAVETAELMADLDELLRESVERAFSSARLTEDGEHRWRRETLAGERDAVIGEGLRRHIVDLLGGVGADRIPRRVVQRIIRAIRDHRADPRRFLCAGRVEVVVGASEIRMRLLPAEEPGDAR